MPCTIVLHPLVHAPIARVETQAASVATGLPLSHPLLHSCPVGHGVHTTVAPPVRAGPPWSTRGKCPVECGIRNAEIGLRRLYGVLRGCQERMLVPIASIGPRPLQDGEVAPGRCLLARLRIPVAFIGPQPLQHLEVATLCRGAACPRAPAAASGARPLQNVKMTTRRGRWCRHHRRAGRLRVTCRARATTPTFECCPPLAAGPSTLSFSYPS